MVRSIVGKRAILAALCLAALGFGAASVMAEPSQTGRVAAATKEGKVTLYVGLVPQVVRTIKDNFEKLYPGISLDFVFLSGAPMLTRLMSEEDAGRHIADVAYIEEPRLGPLREKGYLARFDSVERDHYDRKWWSNPTGYWVETLAFTTGIMFNKTMVPPAAIPTSFDSLLDPRWAGKIAIISPVTNDMVLAMFAGLIRDRGAEGSTRYLRALAAQKPLVLGPAGSRVGQGVFTGEFPVGIGYLSQVYSIGGGENGPMGFVPGNASVYGVPGLASAVMAGAPHPNAARLLVDYLNGQAVQQGLTDLGYDSHRDDVRKPPAMARMEVVAVPPLSDAETNALRARFNTLFGLSPG